MRNIRPHGFENRLQFHPPPPPPTPGASVFFVGSYTPVRHLFFAGSYTPVKPYGAELIERVASGCGGGGGGLSGL